MSSQLTEAELAALMPSELCQYQTPIPTQIVASDEFYPDPQNERQRDVEARLLAMADDLGAKHHGNADRQQDARLAQPLLDVADCLAADAQLAGKRLLGQTEAFAVLSDGRLETRHARQDCS